MNIAIVGGRNFEDFDLLEKVILDFISAGNHIDSIVSGGAKGADSLAEKFAEKHAVKTTVFKPDYKRYGRAATVIRNTQIIPILSLPFGTVILKERAIQSKKLKYQEKV